jgi:replicative DNA helicase
MIDPSMFTQVTDILKNDYFYNRSNRIIFYCLERINDRNEPIDSLTLVEQLKKSRKLEEVGGMSYLMEIASAVPSAINILHYAKIVRDKHIARSLIKTAEDITSISYDSEDIEKLIETSEQKIYDVSNIYKIDTKSIFEAKEIVNENIKLIQLLKDNKMSVSGISTGFPLLDKKLSGFQNTDFIILAARPSVGKTSLALDFMRHVALHQNIPTLFFSLEMSKTQLMNKMLSAEADVDAWKLKTGNVSDEEMSRLTDTSKKIEQCPLFIDDKSNTTFKKIRSTIRRIKKTKEIKLIIIDYLQLMTQNLARGDVTNQVAEISKSLKNIAKDFDLPIICLSQLSRDVEKRGGKPKLSDLRDSGSIEQDADIVMFLHREFDEETSSKKLETELIIAKHRNGATGKIDLIFDDTKTTFKETDQVKKEDFGDYSSIIKQKAF